MMRIRKLSTLVTLCAALSGTAPALAQAPAAAPNKAPAAQKAPTKASTGVSDPLLARPPNGGE